MKYKKKDTCMNFHCSELFVIDTLKVKSGGNAREAIESCTDVESLLETLETVKPAANWY